MKKQEVTKPRKITQNLLLGAASLTKSSSESTYIYIYIYILLISLFIYLSIFLSNIFNLSQSLSGTEAYLGRVTHLHLQGKRIKKIEGLDVCAGIKVLYLYENLIEEINNIDALTILQYLYLQNNKIKEIPELSFPCLTKLQLEENELSYITGLTNCVKLEELFVSSQRLPSYTALAFDFVSLQAISSSLQVLDISNNVISILTPFTILYNLRKMYCSDNNVKDITEIESIMSLNVLAEASFNGNPCASILHYRDYAIGAASDSLRILDGQTVPRHQLVSIIYYL
jgi:Leucine-rich repeat (LRR) protein